jgi:carbon storage regulator
MLVLTRKLGEQILVGKDITITVLAIQGNRIRLGVKAPEGVPVVRTELNDCPAPDAPRCVIRP